MADFSTISLQLQCNWIESNKLIGLMDLLLIPSLYPLISFSLIALTPLLRIFHFNKEHYDYRDLY